jgi:prepilin peptidase CpaA
VKLVAALGAWLGPGAALWLGAFAAMAGGVMALVLAAWRGYLGQALGNVWSLLMFWRIVGIRPHPAVTLETPGAPKLPYSLPILAGLIVVLWRG